MDGKFNRIGTIEQWRMMSPLCSFWTMYMLVPCNSNLCFSATRQVSGFWFVWLVMSLSERVCAVQITTLRPEKPSEYPSFTTVAVAALKISVVECWRACWASRSSAIPVGSVASPGSSQGREFSISFRFSRLSIFFSLRKSAITSLGRGDTHTWIWKYDLTSISPLFYPSPYRSWN